TVGEEPAFLKAGGMVELEGSPGKLWFDVNLDAVREGHLRLSAQLLSLARHVIQRDARGEAAKS
ncbi:MAG TPA: YfiR family protein, partial [Dongiaceae bacterium]|nr:YfiR family protein [Dongiaceae bacterium]